ncbi:phage shock protein C (PspC) family protein [Streptoalloteichus tenebrarius]|uniref:Phage shock protein C (PspC) family protein n=1 Tax=Streptoalloteichus tenebrarius (strain ATCC 17920 / DSM 40477 / JCM 4838 / CBS 697.72 / NBRC 16177 / NCIMB 11028 / NRRL B-12390 / A12253. 1 / ISP 5477) TaxID=1933 RepID=A0ABT1HVD4_STRSD|nr:phage shock protein C (PspC) family protein [Streptoalloteichus tenebrarius]
MFENTTFESAARRVGGKVGEFGETVRDGMDNAGRAVRRFRRSRTDRMLGGVCGGAATRLGVDAALLRILLVAATLFGFGAGGLLYVACWLLVPEED